MVENRVAEEPKDNDEIGIRCFGFILFGEELGGGGGKTSI